MRTTCMSTEKIIPFFAGFTLPLPFPFVYSVQRLTRLIAQSTFVY